MLEKSIDFLFPSLLFTALPTLRVFFDRLKKPRLAPNLCESENDLDFLTYASQAGLRDG